MTCRHQPGDRSCTSQYPTPYVPPTPTTPDAENYEVVDVVQCGTRMVLKVQYPNCKSCSYEGCKVLVFDNTSPIDVIRWRRIDPHFSAPRARRANEAPSPMARFPASEEGWKQAIWFANTYGIKRGDQTW